LNTKQSVKERTLPPHVLPTTLLFTAELKITWHIVLLRKPYEKRLGSEFYQL